MINKLDKKNVIIVNNNRSIDNFLGINECLFTKKLTTGEIKYCLNKGYIVYEILSDSNLMRLNYNNYNKKSKDIDKLELNTLLSSLKDIDLSDYTNKSKYLISKYIDKIESENIVSVFDLQNKINLLNKCKNKLELKGDSIELRNLIDNININNYVSQDKLILKEEISKTRSKLTMEMSQSEIDTLIHNLNKIINEMSVKGDLTQIKETFNIFKENVKKNKYHARCKDDIDNIEYNCNNIISHNDARKKDIESFYNTLNKKINDILTNKTYNCLFNKINHMPKDNKNLDKYNHVLANSKSENEFTRLLK